MTIDFTLLHLQAMERIERNYRKQLRRTYCLYGLIQIAVIAFTMWLYNSEFMNQFYKTRLEETLYPPTILTIVVVTLIYLFTRSK